MTSDLLLLGYLVLWMLECGVRERRGFLITCNSLTLAHVQ